MMIKRQLNNLRRKELLYMKSTRGQSTLILFTMLTFTIFFNYMCIRLRTLIEKPN